MNTFAICLPFRRRRRYHTVYLHASSICSIDFGCKQKYLWSCFLVLMFVQFFLTDNFTITKGSISSNNQIIYVHCLALQCLHKKNYSSQFELISSPFLHLPACRRLLFPLFHACNKGNRRRLHAGNSYTGAASP